MSAGDSTDSGDAKKPSMAGLKTGAFERNFALTRLGLGAGTQIVAHSLFNIFRGEVRRSQADREFYERQAEVLADELGRLKGSVMKAGQMLSLYGQYFLPEEAVAVLSQLQDDTPAVQWRVVAPVLERALGRQRLAELEVETEPLAAASLGQVHRAVRKSDGLELVLKVQYPGVAAAIDSDIKTLSRLLLMTRLAPRGMDLGPAFAETREMMHREVDYAAEARFTEDFARRLAGDARFVVPRVLREYCGPQVLATTYEAGVSPRHESVRALPLARRNRLGLAFLELFLTEFFDWTLVQTDPHFGNYRIRIGGGEVEDRIVLLDFGATRRYERRFVNAYREIVRGAVLGNANAIERGAERIGLMQAAFPETVRNAFALMCQLIVEPFYEADDPRMPPGLIGANGYRWGASDLPMRAANIAARNALSVYFRMPPREIVFLHRRLGGVFVMLAMLDVELRARPLLLRKLELERSPAAE
ncbi:MAG: AarF/ABC1/UbiB kinase family protein [Nevskia sp.]|nr:AarF/ABC1/UbiB kinase family protein [Nevskia sp.]